MGMIDLSPADIRHKEFNTNMGGYKKNEVRAFLELVASKFEEYYYQKPTEEQAAPSFSAPVNTQSVNDQLLENLQKKEELISKTLIQAETTRNDIIKLAQKEADNILREAELTAKKAIDETKHYLNLMKLEFINLKENHRQHLMACHSQLKVQIQRLEQDPLFTKETEAELNQKFEEATKLELPEKEEVLVTPEPDEDDSLALDPEISLDEV